MEELLDGRLKRIKMTWKDLLAHNPVEYMPYDKWNQYYVYKKIDPKTGLPQGFRTPTKKLELYGDVFIELGRTGKPMRCRSCRQSSKTTIHCLLP